MVRVHSGGLMTAVPTDETVAHERVLSATVEAAERGERLDRLLARRFGDLSRTRLKHLVEAGLVSVDGATIKDPSLRVKPGQRCAVTLPAPVADAPEAQAMPLDIRYEDADLIVLEKPAGLVVHPAPGSPDRTLVNALLAHCGDSLAGIGGVRRPGIVHRLDKDTSGLMVVAKTERAHAALAADFAARRIERTYLAITWGVPQPREGEISGAIGRNRANRKTMAVVARGGRTALTHYRVLRIFKDVAALTECRLATGRTHQIRVHLAHHGNPLMGDPVYGRSRGRRRALAGPLRSALEAFPRQALHAASLGLRHPASGEWLQFQSELPSDMNDLVAILERV
jgi:23S rRNA pseudouridine1911/1915/1917 synthase